MTSTRTQGPRRRKTGSRHLYKDRFGPEEQQAYEWLLENYRSAIDGLGDDIVQAVTRGDVDLSTLSGIRAVLEPRIGDYRSEIAVVMQEGTQRGAQAGRQLAARRHSLDIAFDVVPAETLEEFQQWSEEAADHVLETITDDVTRYVRGAHEEGLDIDDITDGIRDDVMEGRLETWQAERTARTATVASSNAGNHSAHADADSVVGEQWLATADDRTRDHHSVADGQVVAVGQRFEVGGEYLRYPGDPQVSASNIVNCRCTVTPVYADDLTASQLEAVQSGGRVYL